MNSVEASRRKLIFLSTSYWDSPLKFRRHQFALIASRNDFDVFYINPTFSFLSFIKDSDCREIFFDFFKIPKTPNDHLRVFTMPPLFPFQKKVHEINVLNRIITRFILKRILKKYVKESPCVFMVYEPTDYFRLIDSKNSIIIYECVDEHSEYPFNASIKEKLIEIEKQLIARSDLLSVTSNYLLDRKKHLHSNYRLTPNGVDYNLFHSALDAKTVIPEDVLNIQQPVILYVGAVMEWFDFQLIIKIANHNKKWNIVIIGPQTINHELFKPYNNIYILGVKHQSKLPGYLKKSAVCIIPFLVNDLVKGVNPLKLYEYMAAGKPVVSSALPDVIPFAKTNIVHIAETHDQFIEHLSYLIERADDQELVKERTSFAKEYSWENIYAELYDRVKILFTK